MNSDMCSEIVQMFYSARTLQSLYVRWQSLAYIHKERLSCNLSAKLNEEEYELYFLILEALDRYHELQKQGTAPPNSDCEDLIKSKAQASIISVALAVLIEMRAMILREKFALPPLSSASVGYEQIRNNVDVSRGAIPKPKKQLTMNYPYTESTFNYTGVPLVAREINVTNETSEPRWRGVTRFRRGDFTTRYSLRRSPSRGYGRSSTTEGVQKEGIDQPRLSRSLKRTIRIDDVPLNSTMQNVDIGQPRPSRILKRQVRAEGGIIVTMQNDDIGQPGPSRIQKRPTTGDGVSNWKMQNDDIGQPGQSRTLKEAIRTITVSNFIMQNDDIGQPRPTRIRKRPIGGRDVLNATIRNDDPSLPGPSRILRRPCKGEGRTSTMKEEQIVPDVNKDENPTLPYNEEEMAELTRSLRIRLKMLLKKQAKDYEISKMEDE